jgi:hypothetical protein
VGGGVGVQFQEQLRHLIKKVTSNSYWFSCHTFIGSHVIHSYTDVCSGILAGAGSWLELVLSWSWFLAGAGSDRGFVAMAVTTAVTLMMLVIHSYTDFLQWYLGWSWF